MILEKGNILDITNAPIYIPTNLALRKDGSAVMGAGLAKKARDMCPTLEAILGQRIREGHDCTTHLHSNVYAFPTKYDWRDKSDLKLVEKSAYEARKLTPEGGCFPAWPGCGLGGLPVQEVSSLFAKIFPEDHWRIIQYV